MIAPTQECNWNCEAEDFEGHPEKIPLGGPSRTEAEHPRPRFGVIIDLLKQPIAGLGVVCLGKE